MAVDMNAPRSGMVERSACQGYGQGVDVWACGVVLYTLLAGFPPFWHRKQLTMIRQIMEAKFSFASSEWSGVSDTAKQLISLMLTVDPNQRLSIDECLHHDFFLSNSLSRSNSRRSSFIGAAPLRQEPVAAQLATALQPVIGHPEHRFEALKKFRLAAIGVRFLVRLQKLKLTPQPLSLRVASQQPYAVKEMRKVIDAAAFRVYAHWVKRGEGQNRAAMFELKPKTELKRQWLMAEEGGS